MSKFLNQRTGERNRVETPILYSRKDGINCYSAELHDCSENGICFTSDFPYLPGTRINVKGKSEIGLMPIEVRWSKKDQKDESGAPCFKVGAKFIETI